MWALMGYVYLLLVAALWAAFARTHIARERTRGLADTKPAGHEPERVAA
jgi:hypothetical protein